MAGTNLYQAVPGTATGAKPVFACIQLKLKSTLSIGEDYRLV
jgi:hypothetical protein